MTISSSARDVAAALAGDDRERLRRTLVALESGELPVDDVVAARLIELLIVASKEVRRRAAGALGVVAADAALRVLVEGALTDGDARRRWGAAFALARAGFADAAVAAAAIEALGDVDGDVRWAAAEIVCSAARADASLVDSVLAAARQGPPRRRKMALYCARDLEAGDAGLFVDALADDDAGVRLAALSGLSRLGCLDAAATRALVACMRADADAGVRRAAAAALGKAARDDAVARDALEEIERSSDDEHLRRAARAALRPRSR